MAHFFQRKGVPPPESYPGQNEVRYRGISPLKEIRPMSSKSAKVLYGSNIVGYGGIGGVVSYLLNEIIQLQPGRVYGKADEGATKLVEKIPGGKIVYEGEKTLLERTAELLGRTPEKQAEWSKKLGISEPSQQSTIKVGTKYKTGIAQLSHEPPKYSTGYVGSVVEHPVLLLLPILIGAAYGAIRGRAGFSERRERIKTHNNSVTVNANLMKVADKVEDLKKMLEILVQQSGKDENTK